MGRFQITYFLYHSMKLQRFFDVPGGVIKMDSQFTDSILSSWNRKRGISHVKSSRFETKMAPTRPKNRSWRVESVTEFRHSTSNLVELSRVLYCAIAPRCAAALPCVHSCFGNWYRLELDLSTSESWVHFLQNSGCDLFALFQSQKLLHCTRAVQSCHSVFTSRWLLVVFAPDSLVYPIFAL